MRTLFQDLRYGARMLAKSPGATAIALITLALGIGVNTGMFSLVNAVHNLPQRFVEPDRLVYLEAVDERHELMSVSSHDYFHWRAQAQSFSDVGLYASALCTLAGQGEPDRIRCVRASANLLPMMGLSARLGRLHTAEEDLPSGERVLVLTEKIWQRKFASDPNVLGQTILLNDKPHTIIGILPPEFAVDDIWWEVELLAPLRVDPAEPRQSSGQWGAIARLNPGVTIEQAQAEMSTVVAGLAEAYPETNAPVDVRIRPLMELFDAEVRLMSKVMLVTVGLVLLIACANLANLQLARATMRGGEIAVRTALGAARTRIVRQLLTESLLLALLGGALGLLVGLWVVDAIIASYAGIPLQPHEVGLSWAVVVYTLIVSGLASLAFGLAPALMATRVSVSDALKQGQAAASASGSRNRLLSGLVIGQLVIALPLLICCALTVRHVGGIKSRDYGFNTERLLTLRVDLPAHRYTTDAQWRAFYRDAIEIIRETPGIEGAGAATAVPGFVGFGGQFAGYSGWAQVTIAGQPPRDPADRRTTWYQPVTPGYFEALEARLLRGRLFTQADDAGALPVALVNEEMVQRNWPDEDPIGKRLTLDADLSEARWITVVGVVGNTIPEPFGQGLTPMLYLPHEQKPQSQMFVVARTAGNPMDAVSALRGAVHRIDAGIPVYNFRSFEDILHEWSRDDRMAAGFFGGLATLALGIASIGLYGVMSFAVQQRTREIGVRVALGASRREIMREVLGRCLRLAGIGIGIGMALAVPVGLMIESELIGVSGLDLAAYVGVSAVLLIVAVSAGYVPARRATKVDPMVALRCE
jgi:putative ABC transport system permease protein